MRPLRVCVVSLSSVLVVAGATAAVAAPEARPQSEWVRRGPGGKLVYKITERGDRILDFSHAGYRGGGVALPRVKVKRTVRSSGGEDDCAVVQSAIDEVSALPLSGGFRGAVLLAPGVYTCPRTLSIAASGVVLRGSGSAVGKSRSTLKLTGSPHAAIRVRAGGDGRPAGQGEGRENALFESAITDAYVPSGTSSLTVADGKGFAAGDTVLVRRPVTEAWVKLMQMHDLTRDGKPQTWLRPGTTLETERKVSAVAGNNLTLDVPLADAIDASHADATKAVVVKIAPRERLTQVGIEQLHIEAPLQEISHSQPHFTAMRFQAEDSWARDLVIDETMNSVSIGGKRITFQRVAINRRAKHQGASKPAEFAPNGSQILLDRCSVTGDNVWFVATGGRQAGPNVVLNSTFEGNARAEAHQRWSTGFLYDNTRAPEGGIELRNRGSMGSGHGWSMGWGVLWNCQAKDYVVQNPPGVHNWMIGSVGESKLSPRPFGNGPMLPEATKDAHGMPVAPESLYLAQLQERLGARALRNLGYSSVNPGRVPAVRGSASRPVPRQALASVTASSEAGGNGAQLGPNLAMDRPVSATSVRGQSRGERQFAGWQALDNDDATAWATEDGVTKARLELDTEGALELNAVELREARGQTGRVRAYKVEGLVQSDWKVLAEGSSIGDRKLHRFARVTVWKVRLSIADASAAPAISTLGLYLDRSVAAGLPQSGAAAAAAR